MQFIIQSARRHSFAAAKVVIILQLCKSCAKKNAIYADLAQMADILGLNMANWTN
jgi:hypothetical protein